MKLLPSQHLANIATYPLDEVLKLKKNKEKVIDLSIGDPDQLPPESVLERLRSAIFERDAHRYPSYMGELCLREAICAFYMRRFSVKLDPNKEVLILIGTKEGIAHLPLALLNPGDYGIVPELAYPVYERGIKLAGGYVYKVRLKEEDFLVDIYNIPPSILNKAKILYLNYPNNPTSASVDISFFKEVIKFAKNHNILICHDAAYSQIFFDTQPPSVLQVEGAKDIACEFYSLSKTYNMAGWRVGALVGNEEVIKVLLQLKTNIDSGVFKPIQYASCEALKENNDSFIDKINEVYRERRDIVVKALSGLFQFNIPKATFYIWIKIPQKYNSSIDFTKDLLTNTNVLVAPGVIFSDNDSLLGQRYFRLSLTQDKSLIKEGVEYIARWMANTI